MLRPRIIPCLDVQDGRVVKGIQFHGLRDAGDPLERALAYSDQGADELALLDVSATPKGRDHGLEVVRRIRAVLPIPLMVGGGVRSVADAERLLEAGADKVGVNSAAVDRPQLLSELANRFGSQCVVLALDAARLPTERAPAWEAVTHSGKSRPGLDAVDWCKQAVRLGAGEILLTSFDRDGTLSGYDLELLSAVCAAVGVPVIASGGAQSATHLREALDVG
ncbi:MAG: cyclase, partial [Planctomycetota bacterium]